MFSDAQCPVTVRRPLFFTIVLIGTGMCEAARTTGVGFLPTLMRSEKQLPPTAEPSRHLSH